MIAGREGIDCSLAALDVHTALLENGVIELANRSIEMEVNLAKKPCQCV